MLVPSRRAGIGSTYNSCEDIATTPASSEVDERPNMGLLASPVLTQERNAAPFRIYHSNIENVESRSSHVPTRTGRPAAMYSHKRKSSRDSHVLVSHSERESFLSIEQSAISLNCKPIMPPKEKK